MTLHWALRCMIPLHPRHNYMKFVLLFLFYTGGNWVMRSRVKPLSDSRSWAFSYHVTQNRLCANRREGKMNSKSWSVREELQGREGAWSVTRPNPHHLAGAGLLVLNPNSSTNWLCDLGQISKLCAYVSLSIKWE